MRQTKYKNIKASALHQPTNQPTSKLITTSPLSPRLTLCVEREAWVNSSSVGAGAPDGSLSMWGSWGGVGRGLVNAPNTLSTCTDSITCKSTWGHLRQCVHALPSVHSLQHCCTVSFPVMPITENHESLIHKSISRILEEVSWCFMPSQPVRLYQGDTHLILYI